MKERGERRKTSFVIALKKPSIGNFSEIIKEKFVKILTGKMKDRGIHWNVRVNREQ